MTIKIKVTSSNGVLYADPGQVPQRTDSTIRVVNKNGVILTSPVNVPTIQTQAISDLANYSTTVQMLGNDATTYANSVAYTVSYVSGQHFATDSAVTGNAATAYANAVAYSSNATNITSGTLPYARLSANVVNTSGNFTITGIQTFQSGIVVSNTITANGSNGVAGQVLTSNGAGLYWSTPAPATNADAQYTWSNTQTFTNTITFSQTIIGTANNANNLGGVSLSTLQSQITGNATTSYTNATSYADSKAAAAYSNAVANAAALYQTTAGLSANVAALAANSATYLGNSSGTLANVASWITGNAATAYTNATSYVVAQSFVNTTQLSSNLSNYASLSGATFTGQVNATTFNTTGNASIGGTLSVTGNLTVSGNVNVIGGNNLSIVDNMIYLNSNSINTNPDIGFAANYNDGTYHHTGFFRDHASGVWKVFDGYLPEPDASIYIDQTNSSFNIAPFQANNIFVGNTTVYGTINATNFSGTANNTIYLGNSAGTLANVASWITGNAAIAYSNATSYADSKAATAYSNAVANAAALYQTTAGLSANVATLTSNNSNNLNGQPGSYYTNATNITTGTLPYAQLGANVVNTSAAFTITAVHTHNANIVANTTSILIQNATTVSVINTNGIYIGNTTTNVIIANTTSSFGGNVSVTGAVTAANLSASLFTGNVTGTVSNATNLNSQPGSYYTNATNITTGTLPYAQLGTNVVNTTSAFTITGVHTHNANIIANAASILVQNATSVSVINTNGIYVGNTTTNVVISNTVSSFFGNVGIANSAPDATLKVTGTANVSGNVVIGGTITGAGNLNFTGTNNYFNSIVTVNSGLYRLTVNGPAYWMQQDGTGRNHWYWNTSGGGSPTFAYAAEDASALSLTVTNSGAGGSFFHRSASGVGKLAGDPITWTTTIYSDINTFTWKGFAVAVANGATYSITANNSTNLNGQPGSYYTNATNITTGTLPWAQAPTNTVNTTGNFTMSGNLFFTGANIEFQSTPSTLGNTATNSANNFDLLTSVNNASRLRFYTYRFANGTSWTTASTRIQQRIDSTDQAYIEFNPQNYQYGVGLYGSAGQGITVSQFGPVSVTSTFISGNSSTNTQIFTNASIAFANATTTTTIGLTDIRVGNTTTNVVITNTTSSFGGNVSVTGALSAANLSASLFTGNVTGTASNATNLNSQPGSYYTNATNITTGTLPYAQLPDNLVNTSAAFTITGMHTYSNGITFSNTITANGSNGTAGQVLTSSGVTGNVYWSTISAGGVNTAAQYTWSNLNTYTANLHIGNSTVNTQISNSVLVASDGNTATHNTSSLSVGNSTANAVFGPTTITINGSGIANSTGANNAFNLGGTSLSTLQSQITGNAATAYSNAVANAAALYQTTAGLSANVATLTANAATYLGNSSGTIANVASWVTGNAATAYSNAVANAAALYQTTTGLSANVATLTSNNANYLGTVAAASYVQNTDSRVLSGNINFTAANVYYNTGLFVSTINATSNGVAINTTSVSVGNSSVNTSINATSFSGTANNSTNLGGVSLSTLQSQITGNAATAYSNAVANAAALYQTTAGLSANVATLTANAATYLGNSSGTIANVASWVTGNAATAYSNAVANAAALYQTTAGLSANVATLTANNANYLGTVAAASYVQNTDSRVLSGNINFTAANVYYNTGLFVSTINATSNGVAINTTSITIGNSTVNTTVNATTFSGTASNATNLNSQPGSYYTNATNITTGTLPWAQVPSGTVNTSGSFTITGVHTHNANIVANAASVLVQNATSISVINTNGIYVGNTTTNVVISNTISTFGGNLAVTGVANVTGNVTIGASAFFVGNGVYLTTVNATNITTGTLPYAQLGVNVVNTTGSFTITGLDTFQANLHTGNSTVNTQISNATILISNSTSTTTLGLTDLRLGSTTTNVVISNTTSSFGGNVTVTSYLNVGNVASNGTAYVSNGFYVVAGNWGEVKTNITINSSNGNYQYWASNGAYTITAPAQDCAVDILLTNGTAAGTITFSGFTVGASTGSAYATTNGNRYILSVRRINSISTYSWYALQ